MPRRPKPPKRSMCYEDYGNKTVFDSERQQYVPLITSDDLDDLQKWMKKHKVVYPDASTRDPRDLGEVKLVQEAFDTLVKLYLNDSIELPQSSYELKHHMERHMPTYFYCSTEQAVLAALLYGLKVDFGPKTARGRFTPVVFDHVFY